MAKSFPGARIVNGYEALLTDVDVDAVYIATPHTGHAEWAIKAIRAGKHVLVEKPIALSAYDAEAIYYEAKKAGVFAGEAFMYRVHPQTAEAGRAGQKRRNRRRSASSAPASASTWARVQAGAPVVRQ